MRVFIWGTANLVGIALLASAALAASPSERADRETQEAMAMDAHPDRGAKVFGQFCVKCHGAGALGSAKRGIPAIAGQRHAYLVRQLANFANAERDSSAMHAVVTLPALHAAQVWTDLAAYLNGLPNRSPLSPGSGEERRPRARNFPRAMRRVPRSRCGRGRGRVRSVPATSALRVFACTDAQAGARLSAQSG